MTSPELINQCQPRSIPNYLKTLSTSNWNMDLFNSFSGEGKTCCGYTQRKSSMTREESQPQTQPIHEVNTRTQT